MTCSSRRRFLIALGAGALATRLAERRAWAEDGAVRANGPPATTKEPPLCFVGVYLPHGYAAELWRPGPGFDLRYPGCSLAPFDDPERFGRSFKDRLLVLEGLDLAAGIEVGTVGHDASRVILTGSGANGKNASIDQFLAVERLLGRETPHTSLTLAVGNDKTDLGANISYAAGGTPVPKWIDPVHVFHELFGAQLSGRGAAELTAERARKKSVLDFVRADLSGLHARVPRSERLLLEQHATGLREIEKRLAPSDRSCPAPERPDPTGFPKLAAHGGGEPFFERITELHVDLLARALACDLTRFATLMLADLTRTKIYPELPTDIHTDVAHRYLSEDNGTSADPESWRRLALQNHHSHAQLARLLQRLDEAALLDRVLLVAQSDMGDPARHSSRNVPTLVFGGGGSFRMGRYLDLRASKGDALLPNNRLLVSVCQAFGVPVERFGNSANAKTTTGSLDVLAARVAG